MISTTLNGLVFPTIHPGQMPKYQFDPGSYIRDLNDLYLAPSYGKAVVEHIGKVVEKGAEFVEDVVEKSRWYEPPKGRHVDEWA